MKNRHRTASANRLVAMMVTLTVVLFVSAVSYVFYNQKDTAQVQANSANTLVATASEKQPSDIEKDSDGDGLADWEEILWSTDPNNADTDGNGVHDKEQILSEKSLATNSSETLSFEVRATGTPLTITEIASRELFGSYMFSLQNGQKLSTADQELMAEQTLQKIAPLLPSSTYSKADVHSIPATQENREQYARDLQGILGSMVTNVKNEAESLYKLAQGNRVEALEELSVSVTQYKEYIEQLKKISVPEDATDIHANLIYNFENYVFILEGFTYFESDPMRSATSIGTVQNSFAQVNDSFKKIGEYIVVNHLYGQAPQN